MPSAFQTDLVDTGDGHRLYVAQYGNPHAPAAVVLHGGPASSSQPSMLDWFDLERQRVVLFDQRGAGQSLPAGELTANTTAHLVTDIERLRRHVGVTQWTVVGGSWGAMLGLAYLGAHPDAVQALVLRGVFLPTQAQLDWFFQQLQALVPDGWAALTRGMRANERRAVLATLAQRLLHGMPDAAQDAARRWAEYEDAVMRQMHGSRVGATPPATSVTASATSTPAATDTAVTAATTATADASSAMAPAASAAEPPASNAAMAAERMRNKYRLQAHYLLHDCFTTERRLMHAARRSTAPIICVHGTHDWICPPANAIRLKRLVPRTELRWIAGGTHTAADPQIKAALRAAIADAFALAAVR